MGAGLFAGHNKQQTACPEHLVRAASATHFNFHELLLILFRTRTISAGTAAGVQHLCDFVECKLPAEDWYLSNKPTKKPLDNPGGPLSGAKLRPK